jgi:hypothetical protein
MALIVTVDPGANGLPARVAIAGEVDRSTPLELEDACSARWLEFVEEPEQAPA